MRYLTLTEVLDLYERILEHSGGTVHELSRANKLRLTQFLVADLAKEEGIQALDVEKNYPVWSPYNAFEAAETLLEALDEDKIG